MKFSIVDYKTIVSHCYDDDDINKAKELFKDDYHFYSEFERQVIRDMINLRIGLIKQNHGK